MAGIISETSQQRLVEFESKLRELFRDVFQHHHADLRGKFDSILGKAETWCKSLKQEDFDQLEHDLESLQPDETILVRASGDLSAGFSGAVDSNSKLQFL